MSFWQNLGAYLKIGSLVSSMYYMSILSIVVDNWQKAIIKTQSTKSTNKYIYIYNFLYDQLIKISCLVDFVMLTACFDWGSVVRSRDGSVTLYLWCPKQQYECVELFLRGWSFWASCSWVIDVIEFYVRHGIECSGIRMCEIPLEIHVIGQNNCRPDFSLSCWWAVGSHSSMIWI